jgi:hypothetical protein
VDGDQKISCELFFFFGDDVAKRDEN